MPQVRLVEEKNEQVGIGPTSDAMRRAREASLDLVEVAPAERPPVCRIMDHGRFKYSQSRKKQKKHREQKLKEIRLHPDVGDHDRRIKMKKALQFLDKGDKVQFTMIFRGRERFHKDIGVKMFDDIITEFGEQVRVERPARGEGQRLIMILAPAKH